MDKGVRTSLERVAEFFTRELPACTDAFTGEPDIESSMMALEVCRVDEPKLRDCLRGMAESVLDSLGDEVSQCR